MISYIKGEITEILNDRIIIENGNMGYGVLVTSSLLSSLSTSDRQIKIYTYMHVREDAISLYGFSTKDDLNIFKLLIQVNGIGPKGALGILSSMSPDDLRIAVLSEDIKAITKAPGIGNKTAQKLIIELKDKLKLEDVLNVDNNSLADISGANEIKSEGIQALSALGYSDSQAYKAVNLVYNESINSVEELIKAALKKAGSL